MPDDTSFQGCLKGEGVQQAFLRARRAGKNTHLLKNKVSPIPVAEI